jgi:hypothetical protein
MENGRGALCASSVFVSDGRLADAGNSAGQRTAQQFFDRNGMAALLMGNEEFAIAFPPALVKLHRVDSMGAPHIDLQLRKFKTLWLVGIPDALLDLRGHF